MDHSPATSAHHEEHHGGTAIYFAVFIALVILTCISFATANMGWPKLISNTVMVAVSSLKALLVILFFMHLKWEANWKYILTFPAGGMSLFLVAMLWVEFGTRTSTYSEERRVHSPAPVVAEHGAGEHVEARGGQGGH
jgi:cytochrome c oxidase subunit 4